MTDLFSRTKLESINLGESGYSYLEKLKDFVHGGQKYTVLGIYELQHMAENIVGRFSVRSPEGLVKHCILHIDCLAKKDQVKVDIVGSVRDTPDDVFDCLELDRLCGRELFQETLRIIEEYHRKMRKDLE
mgnify:CR=1 FL=1